MSDQDWSKFQRTYVQRASELPELLQCLGDSEAIGLDVEMGQKIHRLPGGVTRGEQILALIQIAAPGVSLVVDPIAVKDLSALKPIMAGQALKVVLAGGTDIQLLEEQGIHVRNVIDVAEMAMAVYGSREEGMQALASRALGIQVDKSVRRADWLKRPLHKSLLDYAFQDAELTLRLFRWFRQHHPDLVRRHLRSELMPSPPPGVARWIQRFLLKRRDIFAILLEEGIDPDAQKPQLIREVQEALKAGLTPPQLRRVVRLAGDLELTDLYPDIVHLADSPSAVLRGAAARALGRMNDKRAKTVLRRLENDHIEDVRVSAQNGLKTLEAKPRARRATEKTGRVTTGESRAPKPHRT